MPVDEKPPAMPGDIYLYKNEPNAAHDYLTNVQTKSADVYTER